MTREEAIEKVKFLCDNACNYYLGRENTIALYMALEALEEPRPTVEHTTEKWIPLETRPMDEDERKEWSEKLGYKLGDYEAVIYVGLLPDDGQEVLICLRNGDIKMDTFVEDDCGCYFDEYGEMDGVVAWMPLPKPWEE